MNILDSALAAAAAGLSVVPPRMDGTKAPFGNWKPNQSVSASPIQIKRWYVDQHMPGIGLVTGKVSGNLECLEFDDKPTYLAFVQAAEECGLAPLVHRIEAGYLEESPKPGVHWLYRCNEIGGNTKLARRSKQSEEMAHARDREQVLIETRGEGGYVIVAPSSGPTHPSGKPYVQISGGFDTIVTITPEERRDLFNLARTFNIASGHISAEHVAAEHRTAEHTPSGVRPGDDFNAKSSWKQLLTDHGWAFVYTKDGCDYWRRPGKTSGISACTGWGGKDYFYCWSASTEFDPEKPYDKFGFYARTAHGGDIQKAAEALVKTGFGVKNHESPLRKAAKPYTSVSVNSDTTYEHPDVIEKLNRDHAIVQTGNRVLILSESVDPVLHRSALSLLTQSDFMLIYSNKRVQVFSNEKERVEWVTWSKYWINHKDRRQYKGIAFVPGETPAGYFNLWRGFAVKAKQGRCDLLKAHMGTVLCNGNHEKYNYLWKWSAHAVQRPAELPEVAVVMRSKQGAGKNTYSDALGRIFGPHYLTLNQPGLLCGRFTAHLADAVLVYANEAVWGGDKVGEGKLKSMITDPVEMIEAKGKDPITVPNYKRIIVGSNETWAIPRGIDDRRFFCLDVSSHRIGDREYFAALREEIDHGGVEAFLYELLHTNLEGWHPRANLPSNNTDGEDMKTESMSSTLKFWYHCLIVGGNAYGIDDDLPNWSMQVGKEAFYLRYLAWCDSQRITHRSHINQFSKDLGIAVEYTTGRPRTGNEERKRVFELPSLAESRRQFQDRVARVVFDD